MRKNVTLEGGGLGGGELGVVLSYKIDNPRILYNNLYLDF